MRGKIPSLAINYWILLCHHLNEVFFSLFFSAFNRCNKVYLFKSCASIVAQRFAFAPSNVSCYKINFIIIYGTKCFEQQKSHSHSHWNSSSVDLSCWTGSGFFCLFFFSFLIFLVVCLHQNEHSIEIPWIFGWKKWHDDVIGVNFPYLTVAAFSYRTGIFVH